MIVYVGVLMLVAAVLSYRTKDLPSQFSESTYLMLSLLFLCFFGVILVPLDWVVSDSPSAAIIIQGLGQCLLAFLLSMIVFGPKAYFLFSKQRPDKKMLFGVGAGGGTGNTNLTVASTGDSSHLPDLPKSNAPLRGSMKIGSANGASLGGRNSLTGGGAGGGLGVGVARSTTAVPVNSLKFPVTRASMVSLSAANSTSNLNGLGGVGGREIGGGGGGISSFHGNGHVSLPGIEMTGSSPFVTESESTAADSSLPPPPPPYAAAAAPVAPPALVTAASTSGLHPASASASASAAESVPLATPSVPSAPPAAALAPSPRRNIRVHIAPDSILVELQRKNNLEN